MVSYKMVENSLHCEKKKNFLWIIKLNFYNLVICLVLFFSPALIFLCSNVINEYNNYVHSVSNLAKFWIFLIRYIQCGLSCLSKYLQLKSVFSRVFFCPLFSGRWVPVVGLTEQCGHQLVVLAHVLASNGLWEGSDLGWLFGEVCQ